MPDITKNNDYYLEWSALEYENKKKSPDWFWTIGIIIIALFVSSILLKNFLFGVLVLLAGFSLALYGVKKPSIVFFGIGPKGIKIANNIFNYENLKSFWVNYDPPRVKELIIESKKTFMPHITIPLDDADPVKVREYLLKFLKEEKIEESLIITIARLLKI
jgi:hypothetical protein